MLDILFTSCWFSSLSDASDSISPRIFKLIDILFMSCWLFNLLVVYDFVSPHISSLLISYSCLASLKTFQLPLLSELSGYDSKKRSLQLRLEKNVPD